MHLKQKKQQTGSQ